MRLPCLIVALGLLVSAVWSAEPAPKPAPKAAEEEVGLKPGWYIEPGVSALIFDAPDRDAAIYQGTGSDDITGNGKLLPSFDQNAVVPVGRLAVGFVLDDMPSWLGKDFRVEASTNFYWVDMDESKALASGLSVVGIMYDQADINHGVVGDWAWIMNGEAVTPVAKRHDEYRYVDGNLMLKTDYRAGDMVSFSPSLAFVYANLDYDSELKCQAPTGIGDAYVLKERIDTDFVGATIGLDLNLQVTKRIKVTIGGTISPLCSETDYKVANSWYQTDSTAINNTYGFNGDDDQFTWRATGMGTITYQPLSWFRVSAFGGVEHWADIARLRYPSYPAGTNPETPGTGFPKLGYDSMTNFRAGLSFTFILGK